jgi:hypothetical protein
MSVDQQTAREYVEWVEEQVPLMGTSEYLEWFDGEGREEYIASARAAGVEPKE